MQVFLVIADHAYDSNWVVRVYASLTEAIQAATEDVRGCLRIECFELGQKGLVSIYDPLGNLIQSFE